jgi:hypothetical protein
VKKLRLGLLAGRRPPQQTRGHCLRAAPPSTRSRRSGSLARLG